MAKFHNKGKYFYESILNEQIYIYVCIYIYLYPCLKYHIRTLTRVVYIRQEYTN